MVAAARRVGLETSMTNVVRHCMGAGVVAGVLGLALQGCNPTAAPLAVSAPVQAVNPHDEAARLIKTLELSGHRQGSARDYATGKIAGGVSPKLALEREILEERDR